MSWITIVWSMASAVCATLALIHLAIWLKRRSQVAHLLFALTALGATGNGLAELGMLKAGTVEGYVSALRVLFLPLALLVISIVWYAWYYFGNGRRSLAAAVTLVWVLVLVIDAFTPFSPIFSEISGLRLVRAPWGETFALANGITSPLNHVIDFADLMLLVFVVDASATLWRRGNRRRAMLVGGGIAGALLAAVILARMVDAGVLQIPYVITFVYMGAVLVAGYPLSADVLRVAQLARQLQASEADLRESKERIDLVANAAGLVVWTWDIPGDQVWLSEKDRALFGFSQWEKLNAERVRSVVHPEDRQLVRDLVEGSLTTGEEIEAEYRVVLPDGDVRWVMRRARVEFDADGKPVWERGVLVDITERKRAEERLGLVVEAAPNAMIMVNTEGRITLVNAQAEAVFGYARRELFGHPIEILVPERVRSHHAGDRHGYFGDARTRAMGVGRELFGRRKDGSEVPIEIGLNPIHTAEGLFVLASVIDISERKQAELEAARQRNELAHLSRVTMLGELSGSLAHELNQPLTAILSNAQAAQRFLAHGDADLAEVREILDDIVSEDKRAGEVIHRLRMLLKKGEVQQHSLDLNEVVQDVLKLMRSDLVNQNITADIDLARDLPTVNGDRIQLQQVLLNLVANACDAMTDCDPPERRLVVRTGMENGSVVHVSVSDRGGSIPEEKMEQVFEPFFTTKAEGMGLGLSVCRTIISAHQGKLWATNNADCGATFHFTLPVNGQGGNTDNS